MKRDPDYTVMAAWCVFLAVQGPILCLLDAIRERMNPEDIVSRLKGFHEAHRFAMIGLEAVAFQKVLCERARRGGLPVREISTRNSPDVVYRLDRDKMARVVAATPL